VNALELKLPPPVLAALLAWAMWGLCPAEPMIPLPDAARPWLAIGIAAVGVSFDLLGLLAFRRRRTTVNPLAPHRTSALVTDGVYRVTRNPMYVGLLLLLTAWAVHLASLWGFAGPAVFVPYMTRFQIRPEERVLARRFGDEFAAYAAAVRRWL
jgi:protein-S-isoprenylcysteine O-methyltransferase Ste14